MVVTFEIDKTTPTIIHQTFKSPWTWKESRDSSDQIKDILNADPQQTYHIVSNFLEGQKIPTGSPLLQVRAALQNPPSNLGLVVVVTSSQFIRILIGGIQALADTVFGIKIYIGNSVEDAKQLIEDHESH